MSEAADHVRCPPRRVMRAAAMILSMPLLFAALVVSRAWLNDVMFGAGDAVDARLIMFVIALLCVLWIAPAYWMATAMLSTITVSDGGIRRSGVPGAGLFIPWSAVTQIAHQASLEGEPALLIKGAGGRIALSDGAHVGGQDAISLIERIAADRGLTISPPPENVQRMLEQRRLK